MNNNLCEIICILDKSGSMSGLENSTISGFNKFLEEQRNFTGDTKVTCALFNDNYQILWKNKNLNTCNLTESDYRVGGSTALLDAIGKTILDTGYRFANLTEANRPSKVIIVITTDGQENASHEFTYTKINELITHQHQKYNWEFVFLGANINVKAESHKLGIKSKNTYTYDTTPAGIQKMYKNLSSSITTLRS